MFRTRIRIPRAIPSLVRQPASRFRSTKATYNVPQLEYAAEFSKGFGLLSPEGFNRAWFEYQTLMLQRLEQLTVDTEYEGKDIKQLLISAAREPNKAPIFNHASMAHNNEFFFNGLSPQKVAVPQVLQRKLEENFSSMETLRLQFLLTANAMFGPGFIWLVKLRNLTGSPNGADTYRLLTTYLAGSPYAEAHHRQQSYDMNTVGGTSDEAVSGVSRYLARQASALNTGIKEKAAPGAAAKTAPGGAEVTPLLCLNTWEHVWLHDWGLGVGGTGEEGRGKRGFVEAWWDSINWERVTSIASPSSHRPLLK